MHSQSAMRKETIGQYNAAIAMHQDYIAGVQIARGMLTGTLLFTLMLRIALKKVRFSRIFGFNFFWYGNFNHFYMGSNNSFLLNSTLLYLTSMRSLRNSEI